MVEIANNLTDHELEIHSTDKDNYPYIKMRGGLYWTGSSWAKNTDTIGNGQKDVAAAGTAEVLAASTPCSSVTIKAKHTNTGMIFVGDSSVDSTNGFVLDAGETISIDLSDLALIYLDTNSNGDGVSYFYTV